MFFQRKNSKKAKDSEGSQKKGKYSRGKNDLFDRAKVGLDALAGSLQSAKNDAQTVTEKFQGDVKSGVATILHKGSNLLEKAKEELGSHSEASRSKELEEGVEEQGNKDMDAFNAVIDKVKSHPEVMEKVKDEVKSLADALHLHRHGTKDKKPEAEEKAEEGEAAQNADKGASADSTEDSNVLEQAVEEIQAVVAAVQQQTTPHTETQTEIPVEAAATAETSAAGEKPEETNREAEKDDPNKRLDFFGFFAMLFERFCSPANKKKD